MLGCGVNVELVEGRPRELAEALAAARIDMALTLADEAAPAFRAIYAEGYELALPASHPLAGELEIEAAQLGDSIMIVRRHCEVLAETSRHFTRAGVRPFFSARTASDERALALVAAGLGLTVMPACFKYEGVVRTPLKGFHFSRIVGLSAPADAAFADEVLLAAMNVFERRQG
jgi:DNA-binding transcriptional LysR family regulator